MSFILTTNISVSIAADEVAAYIKIEYVPFRCLKCKKTGHIIGVIFVVCVLAAFIDFDYLCIPYGIAKGLRIINIFQNDLQVPQISTDRLCFGKGIKPIINKGFEKTLAHLDFRKETFSYLEEFQNPCFYRNVSFYKGKHLTTPVHTLRCAPHFFIVGQPKCGTTDVWNGITYHSEVVVKGCKKEPLYFSRKRFFNGKDYMSLDQYLDCFTEAINIIKNTPWNKESKSKPYFNLVTGDGSPDTLYNNNHWQLVPGNDGCNEPRVLNIDYLYHLNPKMRLIFIMRNPVERMWSEYLFLSRFINYTISAEHFHSTVVNAVENHKDCRKYFTERGCAYNNTVYTIKNRLPVGMYHIFIEDLFRLFPKEQILILKFEEFVKYRTAHMKEIFSFLGLHPMTKEEEIFQEKRNISNPRNSKERILGDMLNETRKILTNFYDPYNKRLAKILNDNKYMWNNPL